MSRLIFDITQVIGHLKRNANLTGIQRVELNVIATATQILGESKVAALIQLEKRPYHYLISTAPFAQAADDPLKLNSLVQFCAAKQQGLFPDRIVLKQHLDQFKNNKIKRSAKKLLIYIKCFLDRASLRDQGILISPPIEEVFLTKDQKLAPDDIYICLGTSWMDHKKSGVMAKHHAAGGKTVQMIHDLIPAVKPHLHMAWVAKPFQNWLIDTAHHTDFFICVSKNTQRDLNTFLGKIGITSASGVAPLAHEFAGYQRGDHPSLTSSSHPELKLLGERAFIACVGTIEVRKNGTNLVRAWREICQTNPQAKSMPLVFVGKRSWGLNEFDQAVDICKKEGIDIRIIEGASDSDIAWIYSHCYFSVYPSLYEGWGLPIGESLWFNTPCLSSSTSSMPEVGGALVQYCDPESVGSIVNGLEALLDPVRNSAAKQIISSAPLRRWHDHVEDVLTLIPRR